MSRNCSRFGRIVTDPADQIELINQYNEWQALVKQQKFDESPEAFIKWKAREDAIERLVQVADYVDAELSAHPPDAWDQAVQNMLRGIKHIVEGRAT